MSRINGDKARGALQRTKRIVQRAKARALRLAKSAKAQATSGKSSR